MISTKKTIQVAIRISVYIFIVVGIYIAGEKFIIKPMNKEKKKLMEIQKKLSQMEKLIREVPDPKKGMEEIRERMKELRKKAVSEEELPRVIQQLTKKSSELKIEIISIKPIKELPFKEGHLPSGVSKAYVEVVLKAPYKKIGEYLKELGSLPVIVTIESLSIEKLEEEVTSKKKAVEKNLIATLIISSYTIWKI